MPYLGNNPTANFASVTKDTFSGNASTTAFTLSKPATTNGVAVYVENVRQIPTTAYAISGTTLTFTGAPPSGTNNIYVMHHNTPVSTATHPSAQALTATSGTFSAGVSGTTGTFTSDVSIDGGSFVFNESGAAKDFRVEGDTKTHMLFVDGSADVVGIGGTPATGNNIVTHIKQGDSGAASGDGYHSYSNLIVETNAGEDGGGISIHGDNSSLLQLAFGDPEDANAGIIFYQHSDNTMHFYTNAQMKLKIAENGTHTFKMKDTDGGVETAIWGSGTTSYIQAVSGELYARDSAGNNNLISPHNFEYIPGGASENHAWAFLNKKTSSNISTTKDKDGEDVKIIDTTEAKDFTYVNVDMMKVVREVEKLTGTKLVYTGNQDGDDGSTVKDDIIAELIKRIEALESK